jgi:hypothetical protein
MIYRRLLSHANNSQKKNENFLAIWWKFFCAKEEKIAIKPIWIIIELVLWELRDNKDLIKIDFKLGAHSACMRYYMRNKFHFKIKHFRFKY